jgi:tRNA dimethylallyltransferase
MEIEVIVGPTASGKSALAMERAVQDPTIEIVNADASALYVGFDIGTAKPTKEDRERVPHHVIDILEPSVRFSAFEYSEKARAIINDVIQRGRKPLVVGGTGFYIDALFFGLIPNSASEEETEAARIRAAEEIEELGFDAMHERLREIDPDLYRQINRERNPIRLQRAWEFYYATGKPLGEARKQKTDAFEHQPVFSVMELDRQELWRRIEHRTDKLLADGWVDEVKGLLATGVTLEMPAMRAIGYKEIAQHLNGELTFDEMREKIIFATRQYAKRQSTWMKRYLRTTNDTGNVH